MAPAEDNGGERAPQRGRECVGCRFKVTLGLTGVRVSGVASCEGDHGPDPRHVEGDRCPIPAPNLHGPRPLSRAELAPRVSSVRSLPRQRVCQTSSVSRVEELLASGGQAAKAFGAGFQRMVGLRPAPVGSKLMIASRRI